MSLTVWLAFSLRLAGLGRQSLWYDEAFSLAMAGVAWPTFWAALLSDAVHPPGYYLLLRGTLALLGETEFALRFPSVLAGTLAVPLIYRLGWGLGAKRWGLAAGLLLAFNPFALWYAQEARMYSLLLCLTLATAYTFWKLVSQPNRTHWGWFTLISALSFVVHYFAFIFSLVQFLHLIANLGRLYRALRWWALAQVVAVLPFLPWAWAVVRREGGSFGIGWIQPAALLDLPLTLSNLAFILYEPASLWTWAGLALVIGAIGGGSLSLRTGGASQSRQPSAGPRRARLFRPYTFLSLWLLVPLLFVWLISLRLPLYVDRYFILCLPALLLLMSTISLSSSPVARSTIIGLILAGAVASLRIWFDPGLLKEDWRAAASIIQQAEQSGDTLVMRDLQTGIPFGYYYQGSLPSEVVSINRQTKPLAELVAGHDRLWLVYRRPFEATHALAGSASFTWQQDEQPLIRAWLMAHEPALTQEITFPGVYVVLYTLSLVP